MDKKTVETATCCTCGYKWIKGEYRGHSCTDKLILKIKRLEEEKEPKEIQLSDNQKVMLAATFSSCLLHIKKTTQEGTETKPPTPQESLEAYQTDPLINRYANGCVVGVLEILKLKEV